MRPASEIRPQRTITCKGDRSCGVCGAYVSSRHPELNVVCIGSMSGVGCCFGRRGLIRIGGGVCLGCGTILARSVIGRRGAHCVVHCTFSLDNGAVAVPANYRLMFRNNVVRGNAVSLGGYGLANVINRRSRCFPGMAYDG